MPRMLRELSALLGIRKHRYLPHRSHWALEMAARACPGAARALKIAARACLGVARALEMAARPAWVPTGRSKWPLGPARVPPGRSKWLLRHALEPPERSKWLLEHALERPERSKWLLEVTVRKNCSLLHCPLHPHWSAHLATCMDMHGFTLLHIYISVSYTHLTLPTKRIV